MIELYKAISQNGTVTEKLNVLTYFETLITSQVTANWFINSEFSSIFIQMLKNINSPTLKTRICSIIGQLVWYATVINDDVADSELIDSLIEVLKEESSKVRWKAVAALGEFMFYAAT